ncbi:MAG: DUF1854 domain-containing protein [Pirellulales bacterium]
MSQENNGNHSAELPVCTLSRDRWGHLMVTTPDGTLHEQVRPQRLFPFTGRDGWISLVGKKGNEVVLIREMSELSAKDREILEVELAEREFVPVFEADCELRHAGAVRMSWIPTVGVKFVLQKRRRRAANWPRQGVWWD